MVKISGMSKEIKQKIIELEALTEKLANCTGDEDRLMVLWRNPVVIEFMSQHSWLTKHLATLTPREVVSIKSVIAIGQGETVFSHFDGSEGSLQMFPQILEMLVNVEEAYDTVGGIIGYHKTVLQLIVQKQQEEVEEHYYQPPGVNIMDIYGPINQAIKHGIVDLPKLAEMYPIGGAGDRLSLKDDETGDPLPAAVLPFCGRSLLSGLVRDIQAREFLYYRLMNKQLTTPLAMMTSYEKNNHAYILSIFENESWFGRPKDSFRFFVQPLVPVISNEGGWVMQGPFHLSLKPGGHGVMWKKAVDDEIFDWFKEQGREKLLVRQINNPIAGTDYGLLAFLGMGFKDNKAFGFASCRRMIQAAEGMNVLRERKVGNQYTYCISNVEYTEFEKKGIEDVPASEGSNYSAFPANSNILFADIDVVQNALEKCPIPGMIINMKSKFRHYTPKGEYVEVKGGRLESTMQNIADELVDYFPEKLDPSETFSLKTFVTYNRRRKTLSVTKNSYVEGKSIQGTPPGGFYEMLENHRELLVEHCGMSLPELPSSDEYIKSGPSFVVIHHPALGPCWSIIAQKIRGGSMAEGAEMQLEIAEVDCENLNLSGSLLVEAQDVLGQPDDEGVIQYSRECGKLELKNVTISNAGINREANNNYWRNDLSHHEALRIVLHGNAEFYAEDVTITGDHFIEVPDGYRLVVTEESGELKFDRQNIEQATWYWDYSFDEKDQIILMKRMLHCSA
jgi:UTP---glucose-1-phosphate uridylyltransferase